MQIALHLVRQGAFIEPPNAAEEAEVIETVEVKTDSVGVKDESASEEVAEVGSRSVEGGNNEKDSGNIVDAEVLEAPNDQTNNPTDQGTKLEVDYCCILTIH